jgi:DNA-binding transcriptional LysR family regulator
MNVHMTLNLKHLQYFIAVAEEGHVTRAAERLGMQQPPLSQLIKAMERELDAQLLRRRARGVELTDAGRTFLDNARTILTQLEHTYETTRRTARGEQGRIRVGYTIQVAVHPLFPRVIREFREAFPLVSVTLAHGPPDVLVEHMQNDQIDAVFAMAAIANPEGVVVEALLREAMVVALPSGHALARRKNGRDTALSLKALASETFILIGPPPSASPMQRSAAAEVAACQAAGFSPRIGHFVANNISRLALVAAGLGVALVAASMQRMNIEGVVFRRLKGAPLKATLNLESRRGDTSVVVRQFLKLAMRTATNFDADRGEHRNTHAR